jgi:hypothetical protein
VDVFRPARERGERQFFVEKVAVAAVPLVRPGERKQSLPKSLQPLRDLSPAASA